MLQNYEKNGSPRPVVLVIGGAQEDKEEGK